MANRLKKIPIATKINRNNRNTPFFIPIKYPSIPLDVNDTYVITTVGDRLDSLAYQFYKDVSLWWIIARANPDLFSKDSFALKPGLQVRIPTDYISIIDTFERTNENR